MDETGELSQPADTMRERADDSRLRHWALITGNRWVVTGMLLVGSYLLLLLLYGIGPTVAQKLTTGTTVSSAFGSMIIATVTSVTLVLTIGQLVLSQEIGSLGEQRQQMNRATEFREEVEEACGVDAAPADPSAFFQTLIDLVETRARTLEEAVTEESDSDETGDIVAYTEGVIEHSAVVRDDLEGTTFGSFEMLLPVLNYNYSWKIAAARSLRAHSEGLSETADDAIDDLVEALRFFGPAREHFKTLYFQWEIVNISRAILYAAMPVLMLVGYTVFVNEPSQLSGPGTIARFDTVYLFVSALYVVSLLPFAVLLAYLLRVLTIAKRTLAIGPFILRESEQGE